MKFYPDLQFPKLKVESQSELFDALAQRVIEMGFARDDYAEGLKQREKEYPTGLPVAGGVAIPHTAAEFVSTDTIAVATLENPISFSEMGGASDSKVEVGVVLCLVLVDATKHVSLLSSLIKKIQKTDLIKKLRDAGSSEDIRSLLETYLDE